MTVVIKIEGFKDLVRVNNEDIAVSVREFHRLLGIKKDFTNWFKYQCERLNWVENDHFILLANIGEQTGRGGHNKVDYITSLDNGKHLCMISQGDMAHKIRQYFIKVEKEWKVAKKNWDSPVLVTNRAMELSPETVMATALKYASDVMQEQADKLKAKDAELGARDAKLEAQKPKVELQYSMKRLV